MPDNLTMTVAARDIGGVQYQKVIICTYDGTPVSAFGGSLSGPLPEGTNTIGTVTVGNWPATQPVSISGTVPVSFAGGVAVNNFPAGFLAAQSGPWAVSVDNLPAVQGVSWSGQSVAVSNFPATQPVSGSVSVSNFPSSQAVTGTFWQATQPTQDLKDTGRAIVNAATAIAGVTAVTSEALLTLAVSRDGAATSNLTSISVTSGKRYRITAIVVGLVSTAAAVISGRISLRMNPSGAVTATSPIMLTVPLSQQATALAQAGDSLVVPIPDGIEFSGTQQVGLSQVCSVATGTVRASIIGYEY